MSALLASIADSPRFQRSIMAVIVANAVVLGLQTYSGINRHVGDLLSTLDSIFLAIFCIEIAIRIGAYGRRPWDFFRSGWNVFDFAVVGAAFIPGLYRDATLLRLVRLLRVLRLASVLPDLRVLVRGMVASIKPIASLALLTVLVMYVYGMVGWILFRQEDPQRWGDIGDALLTLFVVMTLESWPDIMGRAMEATPWAWAYFVSYVLIASFLIINVVIAIIITAVEDSRDRERRETAAALLAAEGEDGSVTISDLAAVERRIEALRGALDELEHEIGASVGVERERTGVAMASKARMRP